MESDSGQRNYLISLKQEDVVLWPFMHDTKDDNKSSSKKTLQWQIHSNQQYNCMMWMLYLGT